LEVDQYSDICLELDPALFASPANPWSHWLGASIQVLINGEAIAPGIVSADGRLFPDPSIATAVPLSDMLSSDEGYYFHYCYDGTWTVGEHRLDMIISPLEGEAIALNWTFYREEYAPQIAATAVPFASSDP
jgi:hypothetical protein